MHVPAISLDEYKSTYEWNGFGNIVPLTNVEAGIKMTENGNVGSSIYYQLNGVQVDKPQKGLNIVKIGDKAIKVLMK